jgi:hypothetical protein
MKIVCNVCLGAGLIAVNTLMYRKVCEVLMSDALRLLREIKFQCLHTFSSNCYSNHIATQWTVFRIPERVHLQITIIRVERCTAPLIPLMKTKCRSIKQR